MEGIAGKRARIRMLDFALMSVEEQVATVAQTDVLVSFGFASMFESVLFGIYSRWGGGFVCRRLPASSYPHIFTPI